MVVFFVVGAFWLALIYYFNNSPYGTLPLPLPLPSPLPMMLMLLLCKIAIPRMPDYCQITARLLPDCCQIAARLPVCCQVAARLPDCQIARLPDCQIVRSYAQSLTMVCSPFKWSICVLKKQSKFKTFQHLNKK
jgi:hypothetical protein